MTLRFVFLQMKIIFGKSNLFQVGNVALGLGLPFSKEKVFLENMEQAEICIHSVGIPPVS
jgi:hypothetical protein